MKHQDLLTRWRHNPFFVLEVATGSTRVEIERAAQKLLALMAVGSPKANRCETPLGTIERDADRVRAALAALRDPNTRVVHEFWANVSLEEATGTSTEQGWEEGDGVAKVREPWPRR